MRQKARRKTFLHKYCDIYHRKNRELNFCRMCLQNFMENFFPSIFLSRFTHQKNRKIKKEESIKKSVVLDIQNLLTLSCF